MAFTKVATVEEIPLGQGKQVMLNGRAVALFNVGGTIHALENTCPHRGGPLAEGDVENNEVVCPWHGARFSLTTGAHLCPPASSGVAVYQVQLVGNEIQLDVP
jgi:nitrite reductase/ring-hydroxylating ferredoxin subunit